MRARRILTEDAAGTLPSFMAQDIFEQSLWHATAPAAPATPPLTGQHKAELAIVGAGYSGLSCALAAAQGGASVCVLEAHEIGYGASGRNNGQVIPTLSRMEPEAFAKAANERFLQLVCDSAAITFDLIRKHGMQCEAVQGGWVQPAHSPGRVKLAERRAAAWAKRGAPVEALDRTGVERITGSRYWHGGWQNTSGGKLNALAYARELGRAAMGAGVKVHTRSPALSLMREGSRWRLDTPQGTLSAERVVIATHAYSGDLWPGLAQTVFPVRSYQMATAPQPEEVRRSVLPFDHACSDTQGDLHFFRWDAGGRLVTGGGLAIPFGFDARLRRRIGERIAKVFPQMGVPAFDYLWHGFLGVTLDKIPHLHELAPGVLAWVGCNGRGVALATALGPEIARAALGTPVAELGLPFTPLAPVAGHGIARRFSSLALLLYRKRDRAEVNL